MRNWEKEHNSEFAVPAEIDVLVDAGKVDDISWHNDVCPRFMNTDTRTGMQCLFVQHPDMNSRECFDTYRYAVCELIEDMECGQTMYEGDDLTQAINILLNGKYAK